MYNEKLGQYAEMRGGAALHGRKGGGAMPRGKRAYRVLLWAVLAALLALAAFAGWRLWRVYGDAARAVQLAREMQQTAVSAAGESAAGTDGAEMPAHACPVDFETLRRDYPAVTAWLTGCGGDIDTPVAQGADNIYYLDHLPDGTRNMLGTAFLDSANSASFSDDQSFIFGHHMDTGGGVFAPLLRYQKQEYFEKNPTFTLHTPGGCYTAWVFGAFVVQERAYPYVHEFTSADGMAAFVERVRAQSDIISPVKPAPGDRVLTLCTCTSKTNDLRYVVCAKLIPLA